jgi:two-component system chemotaxis sensor kinase CheA
VGKDPTGRIHLRAYHEAGQVNIEIQDDGRGIDGERIAASAVEKGLAREDRVAAMSTSDKVNLIFLPGFSMSEEITELSGRGVGMDVVKTNLDKLGGLVDIDSRPGEGTTVHVKLPLTLAIIPSLLVSNGSERYAIPQVNVVELLRVPAARIPERIEWLGEAPVVRLRDELLPLLRLSDILGTGPDRNAAASIAEEPSGLNVVVVFTGIFKYGLVVDRLHDSEEIVVKPLGRHLNDCKGYAGATILGDGRVALILDVGDLAELADLASISGSAQETKATETGPSAQEEAPTLLLFRNAETTRFAVPLELV